MPYILLLTLSTLILFTGCIGSSEPIPHQKLIEYKKLEVSCQQTPPETLNATCTTFLNDLNKEQALLDEMRDIREDEKEEASYITLADQEALLALKLHADKAALAKECQIQMPLIVKNDDVNSASFCLLFDENKITLNEYLYLKKFSPRFDTNRQFLDFENTYAQSKLKEGLLALNKGDKRTALNAFKTAADANSAEAAYLVGIIYEEKQIKKAISWHKKAVKEGVNLSKINLARLYLRIKLPLKAKEWYLSAAKDGNALAMYRLFKMDAKSKSRKAREDATMWLDKSAKRNYPQAQYIYGLQLMKQNRATEAQSWLEKAYANGISDSNLFLGKLYYNQESYTLAYKHLYKAQDKGEANYLLAIMYEKGLGIKKNSVMAYRHYKKAHEQGHDNHVADMKRVQKRLTRKERKAAKYIGKKEAKKAKAHIASCGQLPNTKNVTRAKKTINIVGVAVKPIKAANGFIVYGEHEKLYYIIAPEMAAKINNYEYVSLKTKTTGKAITISSDTGILQSIYQFRAIATCK
jgi:TPR repeat protein